jgi:hypothetical protein
MLGLGQGWGCGACAYPDTFKARRGRSDPATDARWIGLLCLVVTATGRASMWLVKKRLADEGMTMIVVTHEMVFARRVANHVVVFERGAIVEEGPPRQIFDAPSSPDPETSSDI